jgi:hypothetical protein
MTINFKVKQKAEFIKQCQQIILYFTLAIALMQARLFTV